MRNGIGTYTRTDGDIYKGEFFNDKMHGRGTYTFKNGIKYTSSWNDDKSDHGTCIYPFDFDETPRRCSYDAAKNTTAPTTRSNSIASEYSIEE